MIQDLHNFAIRIPSLVMLVLGMIRHTSVKFMLSLYKSLYLDTRFEPSSRNMMRNIQLFEQLEKRATTYLTACYGIGSSDCLVTVFLVTGHVHCCCPDITLSYLFFTVVNSYHFDQS